MPFYFLMHNFSEIRQSDDELWPKKQFSRWRPPPSWILKFQFLVTWLQSGSTFAVVYQISSKSDDFSLRYGDLTIFKMAAVRHLGFWKFAVFVMWPLSACRSSWCKISLISENRLMSYGQKKNDFQDGGRRHLEFQKFWLRDCNRVQYTINLSMYLYHFILYVFALVFKFMNEWKEWISDVVYQISSKSDNFFIEIWRFKDFQYGGRPPSWILKICSFCHVHLVDMPFCFLVGNFAELGQSIDELWPK